MAVDDCPTPVPVSPEVPEPAPPAEPPKTVMGVPIGWVVGGTLRSVEDEQIRRQEAEAELRRDAAIEERAASKRAIEKGGAKQYNNQLTTRPEIEKGYVLLTYLTGRGEPLYEDGQLVQCLADVIVGADPKLPTELSLVIVCPRCKARGLPQGQCQLSIRQTNRQWEFDQKGAGEFFPFDDGFGTRMYRLAGRGGARGRLSCGRCNWQARLDNNRVWPEG